MVSAPASRTPDAGRIDMFRHSRTTRGVCDLGPRARSANDDNPVLNAIELAGQRAADVVINPANPANAWFIPACQAGNWTLTETLLLHTAAVPRRRCTDQSRRASPAEAWNRNQRRGHL